MEVSNINILTHIDDLVTALKELRNAIQGGAIIKPVDNILDDELVAFQAKIQFTFMKYIQNPFEDINNSNFNIKLPEEKEINQITPSGDVEDECNTLGEEINKMSISEMQELQKNPNYNPNSFFEFGDTTEIIKKKINKALNSLYGIHGEKLTRTQRVKRNKILRSFLEKL